MYLYYQLSYLMCEHVYSSSFVLVFVLLLIMIEFVGHAIRDLSA